MSVDSKKAAAAAASALPADSADQTVEEYLKAHCNQLVEDLNAHAEGLIQSLQQELEKGKAEILALASGGNAAPVLYNVVLLVKDGPYADGKFTLVQTKTRREFILGRSTGKKVKETGVSLPQDPEVSTIHGKLECRPDGKVFFEDLGSTNGSFLNGQALEERAPAQLQTGDRLRLGATIMEVELVAQQDGGSQ